MSACFYDMGGVMVGVADLHDYIAAPAIPTKTLHFATIPLWSRPRTGDAATVTSEGKEMAKEGFKNYLVPHVPIPIPPVPPGPDEPKMLAIIFATSKSTAYLGRGTVTHGGTPLACCVVSMVGVNGNCGSGPGVVINPNSVVTTPSAGDFASAIVGRALDLLAGELMSDMLKGVPGIDHFTRPILKFLLGFTYKKWLISPVIGDVRKMTRDIVDELL